MTEPMDIFAQFEPFITSDHCFAISRRNLTLWSMKPRATCQAVKANQGWRLPEELSRKEADNGKS